jgi:hypothetical protein
MTSDFPLGEHPGHRTSVEGNALQIALGRIPSDLEPDAASTERVDELKREIEVRRYDVDAGAVAEAIVAKMRLVSQGRRALAANVADRNQKDGGSVRRAH